jgi:hypothetical protein
MPLPDPIVSDLFNIRFKPSRASIDHIADTIESFGFSIKGVRNYDIKIWMDFEDLHGTSGLLIIDRMNRVFEIAVAGYIPGAGDFGVIEDYMALLRRDLNDRVGETKSHKPGRPSRTATS